MLKLKIKLLYLALSKILNSVSYRNENDIQLFDFSTIYRFNKDTFFIDIFLVFFCGILVFWEAVVKPAVERISSVR